MIVGNCIILLINFFFLAYSFHPPNNQKSEQALVIHSGFVPEDGIFPFKTISERMQTTAFLFETTVAGC